MIRPYGALRRLTKLLLVLMAAFSCCIAPTLTASLAAPLSAPRPIRLLAFGDSLTAGYGLPHDQGFEAQLQAALRAQGHDVVVLDGGVSGDTSAGGKDRVDWVLADKPDAAIVEFGGNDGLRGINPADTKANLTAILNAFAAQGIPVLLSGMYAPPNLGQPYERAFRAVFDQLGQRPGMLYDPFFLQGVATVHGLNQADGIHPNAEGVKLIVARLLPLVDKLLAEVKVQQSGSG
jgi:acyl-CoA thioesterase I